MTQYPYLAPEASIAGDDIATIDILDALDTRVADECDYPESDGKPMADNTNQYRTMVMIKENLETMHRHNPQVFVAGDLLWYPRRFSNTICRAPDVMVVFGRPKGDRGSYKQWEEANIPPQVVFEILSPSNTPDEMINKLVFYEHYGVEEYYIYDPDTNNLEGWLRRGTHLEAITPMQGWVSPRVQIHFDLQPDRLDIYTPNGERFMTHAEFKEQAEAERQRAKAERQQAQAERQRAERAEHRAHIERQQAEAERQQAEAERQRADSAEHRAHIEYRRAEAERQQAEAERQRAEAERQQAQAERQRVQAERQRADSAEHRAHIEYQRAERLAAMLRERGIDAEEDMGGNE